MIRIYKNLQKSYLVQAIFLGVFVLSFLSCTIKNKRPKIKYNNSIWIYNHEETYKGEKWIDDGDGKEKLSDFLDTYKTVCKYSSKTYNLSPRIISIDSIDNKKYILTQLKNKKLLFANYELLQYKFLSCGFGDGYLVLVEKTKKKLIFESINSQNSIQRVIFKKLH